MIVAVLSIGQVVAWGVLYYSFSVFIAPIRREFGWSTAEVAGGFSVALGTSAVAGAGVGRWLEHHSPRPLMTLAALAAALLVGAWSRVETLVEFYLVFAGIGVAMAALLYEPAFIVITKRFVARRATALMVLTLVAGLASFIFSPLSELLISAIGWRQALLVLAAFVAALALLFALVLCPSPAERGVAETAIAPPRRRFWLLSLSFVAGAIATTPISVLLVPLLIDSGHDAAFAAGVAALVGVVQIPGRLLFSLMAKRPWGPRLPAAVYGGVTASLLVLALNRGTAAAVAFAILFGLTGGMVALLRATVVADLYGQAHYGAVTGAMGAQVSGARALAPFLAAALAVGVGYSVMLLVFACAGGLATIAGARAAVTSRPAGTATISGTDSRLKSQCKARAL